MKENNNPFKEIDLEELKSLGKCIRESIDGKTVNDNPIKEFPKAELEMYVVIFLNNYYFFDSLDEVKEYINVNYSGSAYVYVAYKIEYYKLFAGYNDVISAQVINSAKKEYYVAVDMDVHGRYNNDRSIFAGKYIWEYEYGNYFLEQIYKELKNRGIVLENNNDLNDLIDRVIQRSRASREEKSNK